MPRNSFPMGSPILRIVVAGVLAAIVAAPAAGQLRPLAEDRGAAGLGLKLRKIASGVSVLTIVAHPDDENNALHALLSRGLGARVSLISLTRGGGGQNEIGPELFDGLRILRTEELLTSHRLDAVEQYFGNVSDFGYSFSAEETLEKWGHEETLEEIVRMIRMLRPDVILTLSPEGTGGGQHHQATGLLTHEAFDAAGDPERFPGHAADGLLPWQPVRLYVGGVGGGGVGREGRPPVRIETAIWDPLLGRTYADLGQEARSAHRCQGMGQVRGALDRLTFLLPTRWADGSEPPAGGVDAAALFGGIPLGLARFEAFVAGDAAARSLLAELETAVGAAQSALRAGAPEESLPGLRESLRVIRRLRRAAAALDPVSAGELEHRLAPKEREIQEAIALAHGLLPDATANTGEATPGGRFGASVAVRVGGSEPISLTSLALALPDGWEAGPAASSAPRRGGPFGRQAPRAPALAPGDFPVALGHGEAARATFDVTVAADAALSRQAFQAAPKEDRFVPTEASLFGLAARPPAVVAEIAFDSGGVPVSVSLPVEYRYEGPWVGTEKQKEVSVLPLAAVEVSPEIVVFPRGEARRELTVAVTHRGRGAATYEVELNAPDGWSVEPASAPAQFTGPGELRLGFALSVASGAAEGAHELTAAARLTSGGHGSQTTFAETVETIAYHHIQTRYRFRPARATATVLDAEIAPVRVGYVEGVGDEVFEAIEQLGVPVTQLEERDLADGDLSRFDTIVLGVRAYLARPDVRTHNHRLLDYVAGGGVLLVQYNKFEFNADQWGPWPISVGRGRVTDEDAPIEVLVPNHPAFAAPNRIGPEDWAGWVQERGLYFLAPDGDPGYVDLLASEDPFPYNAGEKRGILVEARHGEGRWLYLGLGLWRQLPAGTPGAYRLLANLLSLGAPETATDQN